MKMISRRRSGNIFSSTSLHFIITPLSSFLSHLFPISVSLSFSFLFSSLWVSPLLSLNNRYEAIYVVPTINSCLVAEGTIGSILVLHEVPKNWTAFSIGLVLCIAGILVLTTAHKIQPLRKKTLSMEVSKRDARREGLEQV